MQIKKHTANSSSVDIKDSRYTVNQIMSESGPMTNASIFITRGTTKQCDIYMNVLSAITLKFNENLTLGKK